MNKKTSKWMALLISFCFFTLIASSIAFSAKSTLSAGSFGFDVPLLPISEFNFLTAGGAAIGIKYHIADSFVIAPGIAFSSNNETYKSTSTFNDSSSTNQILLGLYYFRPYSEFIMLEMGPSFKVYNYDKKDQTSASNISKTVTNSSTVALNFRPMYLFSDALGIYANLAYAYVNSSSKNSSTSSSETKTTDESTYLYSTFGFVWYL